MVPLCFIHDNLAEKWPFNQQFRQISYSFVLKILCLAEISAMRGLHTANHFLEMEERNPKSKQKLAQPVILSLIHI